MSILVGLAIVTCLIAGEWELSRSANSDTALWSTIAITLFVPVVAAFQSWFLRLRHSVVVEIDASVCSIDPVVQMLEASDWSTRLSRTMVCHTAIWLAASLTIFGLLGWPSVVHDSWRLKGWVIVDDLVMILPVLVSLLASWTVFFRLEQSRGDSMESARDQLRWLSQLAGYLWLRLRMQVLIIVVPVILCLACKDVIGYLPSGMPFSAEVLSLLALIAASATYPLTLRWLMGLTRIELANADGFSDVLDALGRPVSFWRWSTGQRIVNACAMSGLRVSQVMVSDVMQDKFPDSEKEGILRHELAHLYLRHGRIRTAFCLLPLFVWAIAGTLVHGSPFWLEQAEPIVRWSAYLAAFVSLAVYLIGMMRWITYQTELEADLMACCQWLQGEWVWCPRRASEVRQALLRMAAYHPAQWKKSGWLYPSINARVEAIDQAVGCVGSRLRANRWRRWKMVGAVMVLGVSTAWLGLSWIATALT